MNDLPHIIERLPLMYNENLTSNNQILDITTEVTAMPTLGDAPPMPIVPVRDASQETTHNKTNRALEYRMEKFNNLRYLMVAGLIAGLALHGLIRFGGSYNIGSLLFGEKAVAQTVPSKYSNLNTSTDKKLQTPGDGVLGHDPLGMGEPLRWTGSPACCKWRHGKDSPSSGACRPKSAGGCPSKDTWEQRENVRSSLFGAGGAGGAGGVKRGFSNLCYYKYFKTHLISFSSPASPASRASPACPPHKIALLPDTWGWSFPVTSNKTKTVPSKYSNLNTSTNKTKTVPSKYSNLNTSTNKTKQTKQPQPVATKYVNGAPTPDWSSITFKSMKFGGAGSVEFPNIKNPGMKETRTWSAGQSLAEVMELGDFEATEFNIEDLTLEDIAEITGIKLKNLKLSDFETLNWQTLEDLAEAIPKFEDSEVGAIPPIQELVSKVTGSTADYQTVGEVLDNYPELGEMELGKYVKLNKYKLTNIPGIQDAQLKDFTNWQNTTISKVPGLADVPFDQFPSVPIPDVSFIGKVDLPLGSLESGRWKSISGSYQAGFNVPCEKKCGNIEVSGSEQSVALVPKVVGTANPQGNIVTGAQWMSGKDQNVKGGFGILGRLNGGKEPTGRHPFGKSFKQVIWDINEADGSITTAMFFRICKRGWVDLGCSPYFVGPVPFFTYREIDPIILGTPLTVPKK